MQSLLNSRASEFTYLIYLCGRVRAKCKHDDNASDEIDLACQTQKGVRKSKNKDDIIS